MTKILAFPGSLRAGSVNRKLLEAAAENAPEGVEVEIFEGLGDLPFYNEDIDNDTVAPSVVAFRDAVAGADALLFASPMYNSTLPAVLKNAIDWASRPYGQAPIAKKPAAFIGAALGPDGGSFAHEHGLKAVEIAGGTPVPAARVSLTPASKYEETHPRDDAETVSQLSAAVSALVDAAGEPVAS